MQPGTSPWNRVQGGIWYSKGAKRNDQFLVDQREGEVQYFTREPLTQGCYDFVCLPLAMIRIPIPCSKGAWHTKQGKGFMGGTDPT
jgi:hypothetical protein